MEGCVAPGLAVQDGSSGQPQAEGFHQFVPDKSKDISQFQNAKITCDLNKSLDILDQEVEVDEGKSLKEHKMEKGFIPALQQIR